MVYSKPLEVLEPHFDIRHPREIRAGPSSRLGIGGKGSRSWNQWGLGGEVGMGVEAFLIKMEEGSDLFRHFIHIVKGIPGDAP